ncbi:MAG: hypothetical protein HRF42_11730 [Candidatus Brocadia sp.]
MSIVIRPSSLYAWSVIRLIPECLDRGYESPIHIFMRTGSHEDEYVITIEAGIQKTIVPECLVQGTRISGQVRNDRHLSPKVVIWSCKLMLLCTV